jgi:aspartate/methionine/tyrosine aminotransferase
MGESDTLYAAIKSFKGLADIIDFSNGNPLGQPFIPASNAGALAFTSPEMRQYGFTSGLRSVRETVARYIESDVYRSSVLINADNVICGEGGVTALYSSFLKAIIKPDDVVLVTAPGYGLFSNQPKV